MRKLKKGDRVKVSLENASPYRGRSGVVDGEPLEDSFGSWYMVKFQTGSFARVYRFLESELEILPGE
jgi:hypothetical protein